MATTHEYHIPIGATLLRLHLREEHGETEANIADEWSVLIARHEASHPEVEERRQAVREQDAR